MGAVTITIKARPDVKCPFCGAPDMHYRITNVLPEAEVQMVCGNCKSRGPEDVYPTNALARWIDVVTIVERSDREE